jgi:NH3-dependent NAD+ synthetase
VTMASANGGMQRAAEKLQIEGDVVFHLLTQFIHNELTKAGFHRAVLGLSGGVDSAVSCYLAAAALGRRTCSPCACPMPPPRRPVWNTRSW